MIQTLCPAVDCFFAAWYYCQNAGIEDQRNLPEDARKSFLAFPVNVATYKDLTLEQEVFIIRHAAFDTSLSSDELRSLAPSPANLFVKSVQEEFLEPQTFGGPSRSFDRILGYHQIETPASRIHRTWALLSKAVEGLAVKSSFEYSDDSALDQWLASQDEMDPRGTTLMHQLLRVAIPKFTPMMLTIA